MSDFRFADGKFIPSDLPEDDEGLVDAGFFPAQEVGENSGFSYLLHERSKPLGWIVEFRTAGSGCYILVETWPDLIELLAKLSTIAMAGIFDQDDIKAIQELLRRPHV